MPIEQIEITHRDQWLKMREPDITASVAGALLGVHDYTTALELWGLKTGRLAPDEKENEAMKRGRLLEPVAIEMVREDRPKWMVAQGKHYFRDTDRRIGATPDAFVADEEGRKGIIQVKTTTPYSFRKWMGEDGEPPQVPLWIAVQAIVEAKLTKADFAKVAVMVVGFGLDLHILDVPIHDAVYEKLSEKVAQFWDCVEKGEELPADFSKDGEILRAMYPEDDGTEIDLSLDNRILELVEDRISLKAQIKEREEAVKEIDAEVMEKIGDHSAALLSTGQRITWKTQHRKAYSVEATDFRVLRYPRKVSSE